MLDRGSVDLQVRVTVTQVFFAEVVTADKTGATIDNQQFAVVAEIDLEAVAASFRGLATGYFNAFVVHDINIVAW